MTVLIPQVALTFSIYAAMFLFLYPIEVVVYTFLTGPLGFFTAWVAICQQAGFISGLLVTYLLMPEILRSAFDAVLTRECADDLLLISKLKSLKKVPFLTKFGGFIIAIPDSLVLPYIISKAVFVWLLNLIPILGPCLLILFIAPSKGLRAHSRYFALKGYDTSQIKDIYKKHMGLYTGFGITAAVIEQTPILSMLFIYTNTLGAALWSVSIEEQMNQEETLREEVDAVLLPILPLQNSREGKCSTTSTKISANDYVFNTVARTISATEMRFSPGQPSQL